MATWNIYLINRGEPPLLYYEKCSEESARECAQHSLSKVFDGSDADGVLIMRSYYPVPTTWPGRR